MKPKFSFLERFFENIDFVKINKNHRKTNGFYWFFRVRPSKKTPQSDTKTQSKKTSEKSLTKIDLDLHFGLPKPPKMLPKSSRDAKKWGLERSLFRDAMGTARKSSQAGGNRRFETVSLAKNMIRSALSVSLSLCLSVSLSLCLSVSLLICPSSP